MFSIWLFPCPLHPAITNARSLSSVSLRHIFLIVKKRCLCEKNKPRLIRPSAILVRKHRYTWYYFIYCKQIFSFIRSLNSCDLSHYHIYSVIDDDQFLKYCGRHLCRICFMFSRVNVSSIRYIISIS